MGRAGEYSHTTLHHNMPQHATLCNRFTPCHAAMDPYTLFCPIVLCGVVWCGVVWCVVVWCGVVWCGVVWCGVVWCGVVWCGVVWCGVVWCGVVWCGVVWCGVVWCGVVWCGVVWCGVVWCGVVWCGVVWCGVVWCGVVWCGVVWCGMVWCGVVWCAEGAVTRRQRPGCLPLHTSRREGYVCLVWPLVPATLPFCGSYGLHAAGEGEGSAHGGATTTGPDATHPPAICQNSGGAGGRGWSGGVVSWGV